MNACTHTQKTPYGSKRDTAVEDQRKTSQNKNKNNTMSTGIRTHTKKKKKHC
jgi:hypothetical protein